MISFKGVSGDSPPSFLIRIKENVSALFSRLPWLEPCTNALCESPMPIAASSWQRATESLTCQSDRARRRTEEQARCSSKLLECNIEWISKESRWSRNSNLRTPGEVVAAQLTKQTTPRQLPLKKVLGLNSSSILLIRKHLCGKTPPGHIC